MNTKEMTCIVCPIGCSLTVTYDNEKIHSIEGNRCNRGPAYAEKEIFNPERIVTTTVRVKDGTRPLVPVRTSRAVPKGLTFEIVKRASELTVKAPLRVGRVLEENILETGADLITSRSMEEN